MLLILGDLNIHKCEWLVCFSDALVIEHETEQFSAVSSVSHLFELLARTTAKNAICNKKDNTKRSAGRQKFSNG